MRVVRFAEVAERFMAMSRCLDDVARIANGEKHREKVKLWR
jgi:hypothetical protein